MKQLRIGMIGAGQIAYSHCTGINSHPQGSVVAAADKSKERLATLAEKNGIDRTYTGWEKLVADPDIDAVSIALPNYLHAQVAEAALKAGKHVLLDKPFAMNQKEAMRVLAAARAERRVFMLGMNQRFTAPAQTLKVIVERGDLGEIHHARASWMRSSGIPKFGTWFCQKKYAGGGCLLDIGVHVLDLALHLMGNWSPVAVFGMTYSQFGNRKLGEGGWGMSDAKRHVFDVDDLATALIRFRNGATLDLSVAWAHHGEQSGSRVQLLGSEAGAELSPLRIHRFGKIPGESEVVEPRDVVIPHPHANRFHHWIDVILRKEKAICTPAQALTVQKILDGIYESARTGKHAAIK